MRVKCAGHHQHYGTDNVLSNNLYYDVNIGDVPTPGRPQVLMPGFCDAAVRMSTHVRDIATCHPHTTPSVECCCAPGCDQGKCSSLAFERNIVFLPAESVSTIIGATWAHGLDNATFRDNVYFRVGSGPEARLFNTTAFPQASFGGSGGGVSMRPAEGLVDAHGVDGESFTSWQQSKDQGSAFSDPLITSNVTFALASGSPALARGFVPIDVSSIGPRASAVGAPGAQLIPSTPLSSSMKTLNELAAMGLVR